MPLDNIKLYTLKYPFSFFSSVIYLAKGSHYFQG